MKKEEIATGLAPEAIGPYSQGVAVGRFLFLSGQIPVDPMTGNLVEGGVADQSRQVLSNLRQVLEARGASMKDVVKTTVYMTALEGFGEMNEVYAGYFEEPYPARATVGVAALPKGAMVEMDVVAVVGDEPV